jgi:hypothetical protein
MATSVSPHVLIKLSRRIWHIHNNRAANTLLEQKRIITTQHTTVDVVAVATVKKVGRIDMNVTLTHTHTHTHTRSEKSAPSTLHCLRDLISVFNIVLCFPRDSTYNSNSANLRPSRFGISSYPIDDICTESSVHSSSNCNLSYLRMELPRVLAKVTF